MKKLIAAASVAVALVASQVVAADQSGVEWLFVHSADKAVAEGDILTVPVNREIFAFSDRPERRYAHLNAHEFAMGWDERENSFLEDPPNVVITWVEDGEVKRVEAVFTDASVQDLGRSINYAVTGADLDEIPDLMSDVSIYVDGGCIPNGMGACGDVSGGGPGGLF